MKQKYRNCIGLLLAALCLLTGCGRAPAASEAARPTESVAPAEAASYSVPVSLEGGSGRASVESPVAVVSENGVYTARIVWSSASYDFMVVEGKTYYPVNTEGNSTFEIPIPGLACTLAVQADTTAMGQPHLIDYTLVFGGAAASSALEAPGAEKAAGAAQGSVSVPECLTVTGHMELRYAQQFSLDYCLDGSMLLTIAGSSQFLLLPPGNTRPVELPGEVVSIQLPLKNLYLASSSVMDMFRQLGALDAVSMTSTRADSWRIPEIAARMESGEITYVGKYSAPDYEAILAAGCPLAVENTMIYHCPETKAQLETLGVPVLVEYSSYESHPLGRLEWIRLYGILTGREAEAEAFFAESCNQVEAIAAAEGTGKTVAFFSVSTGGYVVVRSPGDYVVKMIEMAGGSYVPAEPEQSSDSKASTRNIQMESFYAAAKDADILIYNGTIEGTMYSTTELDAKSPLFSEFRAVKAGNVWCTEQNVFQQTTGVAGMIEELHRIILGETDEAALTYFHKLT